MANKYKEPADPKYKFKSDLARELSAKRFPIVCGDKKDNKVYKTLAWEIGHRNECPVFESMYPDDVWLWEYHGKDTGLSITTKEDAKVWDAQTFVVKEFEGGDNPKFEKEVSRAELADAIIEGFKVVIPSIDYANLWDELLVRADETIKAVEEKIAEREGWLADPSTYNDWDPSDNGAWQKDNFRKQINSWTKENKALMAAMEEPALSPLIGTVSTNKPKYYLITADAAYDGRTGYFAVAAYDKIAAKKQLNRFNGWFTRRAPTGCTQDPHYLLSTAKVFKEFETLEDYQAYVDSRDIYVLPLNL